ncbi:MAG TPA: S8 family serine peptidase, partial [Verrucomicrobiae bacterium]
MLKLPLYMALCGLSLSSFGAWPFAQPDARARHAADHVIIKFKAEELAKIPGLGKPNGPMSLVSRLGLPAASELVETTLSRLRQSSVHGPAKGQGGKTDFSRHLYLRLPRGLDPAQVVQRLRKHRLVEYVELDGTGKASFTTPNDPNFPEQWHHHNTVFTGGSVPADLDTPDAWDLTRGSTNVIVAIVDTGINAGLPEFDGRLVAGYDFINDDPDPEDSTGHGTAVAAIIGANANNSNGIVGIDWNCKLMALKVVTPEDTFLNSWLADAIDFATDHGAKVINLSLATFSEDNETVTRAITNAIARGVIVIGVTSNEGANWIPFPGSLPEMITVGATDVGDWRAGFSNFGPEIDLVAPGVEVCTLDLNGDIEFPSGTSASAPMVSGVAALIASVKPDVTQEQMRLLLCAGADDGVGDPAEDTPGFDIYYGWGRLNAYNSLVLALTTL